MGGGKRGPDPAPILIHCHLLSSLSPTEIRILCLSASLFARLWFILRDPSCSPPFAPSASRYIPCSPGFGRGWPRFSWGTVRELRHSDVMQPPVAASRGWQEHAGARVILLSRSRHDADIGRLYTWFNDHRPALVQPRSTRAGSRGLRGSANGRKTQHCLLPRPGRQGGERESGVYVGVTSGMAALAVKNVEGGGGGSSTGVSRARRSGPQASSVSSPGVEELLAACLLPSFAIVSFLSVLVSLQFRLIDMYTYNI